MELNEIEKCFVRAMTMQGRIDSIDGEINGLNGLISEAEKELSRLDGVKKGLDADNKKRDGLMTERKKILGDLKDALAVLEREGYSTPLGKTTPPKMVSM